MTKPRCSWIILPVKLKLLFLQDVAFSVAHATWKKPFLPIAVIDYFDVAIIPNFYYEKYLRFSALGGMPRRTSWGLNASLIFYLMHAECSRLCQTAERSNYPSNHVVISHCYKGCVL